jgi:hypothetical protein
VTEEHLRRTAPSDVRVALALQNVLESEAVFVEREDADERLLTLLGWVPAPASEPQTATQGTDDQAVPPLSRRNGLDNHATWPGSRTFLCTNHLPREPSLMKQDELCLKRRGTS